MGVRGPGQNRPGGEKKSREEMDKVVRARDRH